jgi:hypothetical protein
MIIIGEVVAMAEQLDWFQQQLEQQSGEQAAYEVPVISG